MLELLSVPALAIASGLWGVYRTHDTLRRKAGAAATACGLTVEEASNFWSTRVFLKARAGPIQAFIRPNDFFRTPRKKTQVLMAVVTAPCPPAFADLRIIPEHLKLRKAREVEIGDEAFDKAFYLTGPMPLLFAVLDAETRRQMMAANAEEALGIYGGTLQVEVCYRKLPKILGHLVAIARRFLRPLDIAERLAENARSDPNEEVRLRNLLLLAREFLGEPRAREALRIACVDNSPHIRLRAAQELGDEGRGVLLKLAESTEDDAVSAKAAASLGRGLPLERTREILAQALRRRLLQTARVCLEALGGGGAPEDVDLLAKVLAREKEELAAAAAEALGATGSPAAEPPLLLALAHERADARLAAAQALGRAGSAASVLPLQEAAERRHDLRRAARQSIAEIQSRLQSAAPGQLSLAESEAGRLSMAEEAGRLSLS
jgi:HEAT repeats